MYKIIILLLCTIGAFGQEKECYQGEPPRRDIQDSRKYRNVQDDGETRQFAVYFTVIGNLTAITESFLDTEIERLNDAYGGVKRNRIPEEYYGDIGNFNFVFRKAGSRRYDYSGGTWPNFESVASAYPAYQPDKYINVYYCAYRYGGQSIFPNPSIVATYKHINIVNYGNRNSGTTEHEIGHFMNIYHTFQGACVTDPCAGDGCCDTPPYCSSNSCSQSVSCCGISAGSNRWNYMSYNSCRDIFTKDQVKRARAVTSPGAVLSFLVEGSTPPPSSDECKIIKPSKDTTTIVRDRYDIQAKDGNFDKVELYYEIKDFNTVKINEDFVIDIPVQDQNLIYSWTDSPYRLRIGAGRPVIIEWQYKCYDGLNVQSSQKVIVTTVDNTPPPESLIDKTYMLPDNRLKFISEDGRERIID